MCFVANNSQWYVILVVALFSEIHMLFNLVFVDHPVDFLLPQSHFLLYESASGYALFERIETDEIADQLEQMQQSITVGVCFLSFIPDCILQMKFRSAPFKTTIRLHN